MSEAPEISKIPTWTCAKYGQYGHDWLDCPECNNGFEKQNAQDDMRDKTIAEQRAAIDELNAAHDAQNEVLRQKQAELDSTRAWFADIQREFEKELAAARAENAVILGVLRRSLHNLFL